VPLVSTGLNHTAHMEAFIEQRHRLSLCMLVCRFFSPDQTDGSKGRAARSLTFSSACRVRVIVMLWMDILGESAYSLSHLVAGI